MKRWTAILKVALNPTKYSPHFKVAASLLLSPTSKTLAVPSINAILFKGDRVDGTGNPAIDRLSDSNNIAEILISKLGDSVNVWVVEASTFRGHFAVYKEFVPSVNSCGEPKGYDPEGFPASNAVVGIISNCIEQVRSAVPVDKNGSPLAVIPMPKTALFGFSKGGTVINQIFAELANKNVIDAVTTDSQILQTRNSIFPVTKDIFLLSISELHYVDVGLNCRGAYLTDRATIDQVRSTVLVDKKGSPLAEFPMPKTALFGFSKGGTVINQIFAELANKNVIDAVTTDSQNSIFPVTKDSFLLSISELHYVDVGLNCRGAYLTDRAAIDQVARDLMLHNSSLRVVLHGTPRQWCDLNRPWIRDEKDFLHQMLRDAGEKHGGRLQVLERFYFADMHPTLQMHFEIIDSMDVR